MLNEITSIGSYIETTRKRLKLSIRKLSLACDVSMKSIKRIEHDPSNAKLSTIIKIVSYLENVPGFDIIRDDSLK